MLNCRQASQFISTSFDRPLTLRERVALGTHLLICKYCKRFNQQLRVINLYVKKLVQANENDTLINMPSATKNRIIKSLSDITSP